MWESDSFEEFEKGEFKSVSLTNRPELRLAPQLTNLGNTGELLVLSLAMDSKGGIYAGTGSDGRVYRVNGGKPESLFSVKGGQVLSMTTDRNDNVYVGTAPDGIIYRIHENQREQYYATGQKYVWSLVTGDDGALYAGTGDSGVIFKITGKDQGSVLYHAPQPHITALVWQGDLYAGSSGDGLVYRIKGNEAKVVYKTDRAEVRSLLVEPGGVIYAAANPDQEKSPTDGHPLVYRIRPDGNAAVIFTSPDSIIYSLAWRPGEGIENGEGGMVKSLHSPFTIHHSSFLIGAGNKAHLYEINTDTLSGDFGVASMILESQEGQILALLAEPAAGGRRQAAGSVFVGTGNSGKVYRLESQYAKEGTFQSKPFDASAISHWGRCFWTGDVPLGTGITVATRTGNSDDPDQNWSDWQPLSGDLVASPPARYIQYQLTLATADNTQTPSLSRLTIAYVQTNLPPVVKSVSVKPDDDPAKQNIIVSWDVSDPNGDSLCAAIYIKGEKESDWKLLEKDRSGGTKYTISSDRLPDGWYYVKVRVSDKLSNPVGSELYAEKLSSRFLVDNTPPEVGELTASAVGGNKYRLTFVVKDALSLIMKCDVSMNLKDWRPVAPESGIFDNQTESFSIVLEMNKGENVVVVRAQDQAGNTGTAKKVIVAE